MAIENLNPTTELEAINAMLESIGEAPLDALESGEQLETIASDLLTEALREICIRPWRFNSEYNYSIETDGDDSNNFPVFEVPSSLASWRLSLAETNRGIDIVARESRDYTPGTHIFADRLNGTDGIEALEDEDLDINPVWFVDFDMCPQSVRTVVTIGAARRFRNQVMGSVEDVAFGFTEEDEQRALAIMYEEQMEAVPVPALGTSPATELEALNQALQMADKDLAFSLSAIRTEDQYHALQLLRDTSREVQSEGWRFNLEHGFELAPEESTYDWEDSAGDTTTLNIFSPPSDMLDYEVTPSWAQAGEVDVTVRQSVRFTPTQQVFYDRENNRDGLDSDDFDFLYLDLVRLIPFDDIPEVARQYIMILAARRFLQAVGEPQRLIWSERDVRMARRALEKAEGQKRRLNIFDHGDMFEARGRRHVRRSHLTRDITRR